MRRDIDHQHLDPSLLDSVNHSILKTEPR